MFLKGNIHVCNKCYVTIVIIHNKVPKYVLAVLNWVFLKTINLDMADLCITVQSHSI